MPAAVFGTVVVERASPQTPLPSQDGLHQRLRFQAPPAQVWAALRDPALIASCIPGASLTSVVDGAITGEMLVSLGPVRARFAGEAVVDYDDAALSGTVRGGGNDQASGTRLAASARFSVVPDGAGSLLEVVIDFTLRGALGAACEGPGRGAGGGGDCCDVQPPLGRPAGGQRGAGAPGPVRRPAGGQSGLGLAERFVETTA
ncbi:MAG: SRPBCC domain-containing protein [Acetobacteraceae bacterium]